jgi:zinc and cadmium transporter
MTTVAVNALASTLLVSLVSLVGILTLSVSKRYLSRVLFLLISLSAGALLGDVFFHLLPEVVESSAGFSARLSFLILFGIVGFFVLEKFFIWHHHHIVETPEDHAHGEHAHTQSLGTMNLVGDGLHNLLDGMIIAASYMISPAVGFSTTIAVLLHEIPQEIGDFGVLIHSGYSVKKALLFNFFSAALAIAGAIFTLYFGGQSVLFTEALVPVIAGGFIYIAGSDLIPELKKQKLTHESVLQLVALLFGMGLMWLLLFVE